ncbi:MMPL family transporter [Streptomyces lavendulae]
MAARHREELARQPSPAKAMAAACRATAPPFLASVATIDCAMITLTLSTPPAEQASGPAVAIAMACCCRCSWSRPPGSARSPRSAPPTSSSIWLPAAQPLSRPWCCSPSSSSSPSEWTTTSASRATGSAPSSARPRAQANPGARHLHAPAVEAIPTGGSPFRRTDQSAGRVPPNAGCEQLPQHPLPHRTGRTGRSPGRVHGSGRG